MNMATHKDNEEPSDKADSDESQDELGIEAFEKTIVAADKIRTKTSGYWSAY